MRYLPLTPSDRAAMLSNLGGSLLTRFERAGDAARTFWVSSACLPQTIAVVKTRALPLGIEVVAVGECGLDYYRDLLIFARDQNGMGQ